MHIFKMFLAGTFLAAGIVGTFAPWLSSRVHTVFESAAMAAQVETVIEILVPVAVGIIAALVTARRRRATAAA